MKFYYGNIKLLGNRIRWRKNLLEFLWGKVYVKKVFWWDNRDGEVFIEIKFLRRFRNNVNLINWGVLIFWLGFVGLLLKVNCLGK